MNKHVGKLSNILVSQENGLKSYDPWTLFVCSQTPPYTIRSREIKLGTHVYLRAPKQPYNSSTLALHRAVRLGRYYTTAHPPSPLTQLLSLLMTSHWRESYQGEMSLPTRTGHLVLGTQSDSLKTKEIIIDLKKTRAPHPLIISGDSVERVLWF